MCAFCGHPGLVHEFAPTTLDSDAVGGTIALSGSTTSNSGLSAAATPPAGSSPEIDFISGVTSTGQVAATSFWTWNGNNPATYDSVISDAAKWGSTTPGTPGGNVTYWFDAASNWTPTEQTALASGLALWSAEANIAFTSAATAASANFIFYREPHEPGGSSGSAFESSNSTSVLLPSGSTGSFHSTGSYIAIDTSVPGFGPIGDAFSKYGGYPYQTLVHEIGHMIGLGHAGPYNGFVNSHTQQFSAYDTRLWSLMSYINPWDSSAKYYNSYPVTATNWGLVQDPVDHQFYFNEPTTPMILDILAAQQLYGPATSGPLAGGGQVFGFHSNIAGLIAPYFDFTVNTHPVVTLWDGGLNNTLDLSGWSATSVINLNPGTFSSANGGVNNIGIAAGTVIQTAIGGGGNDTILGNPYNDMLIGGGGNDTIIGGTGTDTVIYSGLRSQYQASLNPGGSIHIADLRAGAPNGADDVSSVEFFQFVDYTVSAGAITNHPPVATVSDHLATKGQVISASTLFSASGADNDTLTYFFYDNTADAGSGHFTVNGTVEPANTTFSVTAAQLAQTTFTAGSGVSDDLFVNVYDGNDWSGAKEFHVIVPPNHAPTATVIDHSSPSGQVISVSSLFLANDADNDALTYYFYDNTADAGSGHFTVNGTVEPANTTFSVSAAQLAQTTFTAGSTVSDDLFVNIYDGTSFSQPKEFHVNVPANHAPTATAPDHGASSGQTISASSLFLANDADNNALTYFFYDNTPDGGSGHFTVNGTVEPANTTFALSAAQLAQTTFTAGSTVSDDLFVNVYDGTAFSQPKEFHVVVVPPNQAPMATAPDFSAAKGQVVNASSLFLASDADNDALTYFFYDNTADAGSGHFTVNGTVEPANTTFAVSAAQLAQTTFTAGSTSSDDLFVNIYDGTSFSQPKEFHVIVPPNHAPDATAPDHSAPSGQVINASSLFLANDADNDALTYFFYDNTANGGSGHFTVNGTVEPANTTFSVSAAQLAQTTFTAGSTVSDDLFVNVYDGIAFSQPKEFHLLLA